MSKKEELLSEIKKLSSKIGSVKVYFNQHQTGGNNGMGYYFDEKDKLWKSYVCGEYNFITHESKNEVDVIEYLYNSVCSIFDTNALNYYIKKKLKLDNIDNRYFLDICNYFDIRKSCCTINSDKYLREILCIFYIYNKNIFVCNFDRSKYFWLKDKFK